MYQHMYCDRFIIFNPGFTAITCGAHAYNHTLAIFSNSNPEPPTHHPLPKTLHIYSERSHSVYHLTLSTRRRSTLRADQSFFLLTARAQHPYFELL